MILLLQVAVILASARVMRPLMSRLGQPAVVGEMVAGLFIGPSFFGYLVPRAESALFPADSLGLLNALSQIGLVLFMYIVGIRTRAHASRIRRGAAAVISVVSIIVPFALGAALAMPLHGLAPAGVGRWPFGLFFGAAMSITAFPVLARILTERGLLDSVVGTVAIACAAFDDLFGWLIVAAVLALVGVDSSLAVSTRIVLLAVYIAVMSFAVRPALAWLARRGMLDDSGAGGTVMLVVAFLSAAATEALGVHAFFGAFFAGVMTPGGAGVSAFADTVEPVTTTLLLPLFFAFTGLRTTIGVINSPSLWWAMAAILLTAVVGKGAASAITARVMGFGWRDASTLGVLINTRGLVELVVLNMGLDAGVLSPTAFSMLVVMALTTTLMTSPLISLFQPRRRLEVVGARGEPLQGTAIDFSAGVDR